MKKEKNLDPNCYNRYNMDPSTEEWRYITLKGLDPKRYMVSSFGNVKSVRTGRILKKQMSRFGYLRVSLMNSEKGREKQYSVHRLVAIAFIPNPDPETKFEVNHKNCDRACNYVWNLEWMSRKENMDWAIEHGGMKGWKGFNHPNFSATEKQLTAMYKMLKDGVLTDAEIARQTGLSPQFIYKTSVGKQNQELSRLYNYIPRKAKKMVRKGFYSNHYEELDKLIITGMSTKDIMKAYPLDCSEGTYRGVINTRRNILIEEKKMSPVYDTPHKCLRVSFLKGRKSRKGEDCPTHKYSNEQIEEVCRLLEENLINITSISKKTGVDPGMISQIKQGKNWTHISEKYNIPKHRYGSIPFKYRDEIVELLKSGSSSAEVADILALKYPELINSVGRHPLLMKLAFFKKQIKLGKL